MLSKQTIEIVKSTAPILEIRGKEITTVFYKTLLEAHPELLNIFNHANQKKGRQQTALANTVTAAAHYIDQLEELLPVVKQIAHKHRSLVIKPEHYPIVGEYLLRAIKEVLGDAASDDILKAWEEAYEAIANVFISVEQEMYEETAQKEGGWKEYRDFTVINKVKESDVITSIYLKPTDGGRVADFEPGQYITVRVQIPGEKYLMNRQYSLTNTANGEYYRISVKKEGLAQPAGVVSNYLHDSVEIGDQLEVTVPAGDFVLEEGLEPTTFIAAGVGITPFMSMLNTLCKQNSSRKITVIHAFKNQNVQAFANELSVLSGKMENLDIHYYNEEEDIQDEFYHSGRVNEEVLNQLDKIGVFYVCGPEPFMQSVIQKLQKVGVPLTNIRYEFFGPSMKIEAEKETV